MEKTLQELRARGIDAKRREDGHVMITFDLTSDRKARVAVRAYVAALRKWSGGSSKATVEEELLVDLLGRLRMEDT